ncbi:MAG TPA: tetratricopeptide repeat protein [Anaerolineae bacterium]|nr:tetratricopeptide repeat protein [Anaerolineae bacterium]
MPKIWLGLLLFSFVAGLSCAPKPQAAPLANFMARVEPLIVERRYSEAALMLDEAAQAHPKDPLPLLKLGQIYLSQHRWLLAEDAFNRALARDPGNPLAMAGLAETLYNQGRLTEALNVWQEVTALNPDSHGAFTGLGRTHLALFDVEAAREAFLEQQRLQPDPEAQWYLAALEAPSNLPTALEYLQSMPSAENGELTDGLTARRDYLLAALEPFTAESPQAEVAKATGIALAQAQLWQLAVHALTTAQEKQAEMVDAETLAFLGYALAQAGRPALELFEQAHQADPESALPLYFQGLYLRQQGALKAAEALFKQAVVLDPENAAFYVEMGETKAQKGELGTAEIWYAAATQVAEDDLQFRLLQATFYANWGYRMAEAGIPAAEAIIEADKNNAEAYDLLGWMQFLTGAPEGGEAALRQALVLNPNLISARYHLARQLEAIGRHAEAVEEYQRVVDWDTSGAFRDRALQDLQRLR